MDQQPLYSRLSIYRILGISNFDLNSNKTLVPFGINSSGLTTQTLKLFSGPVRVRDIFSGPVRVQEIES